MKAEPGPRVITMQTLVEDIDAILESVGEQPVAVATDGVISHYLLSATSYERLSGLARITEINVAVAEAHRK